MEDPASLSIAIGQWGTAPTSLDMSQLYLARRAGCWHTEEIGNTLWLWTGMDAIFRAVSKKRQRPWEWETQKMMIKLFSWCAFKPAILPCCLQSMELRVMNKKPSDSPLAHPQPHPLSTSVLPALPSTHVRCGEIPVGCGTRASLPSDF